MISKVNVGMVKSYSEYHVGSFPIRLKTNLRDELLVEKRREGATVDELAEEFNISLMVVVKILSKKDVE
jgi:uncharacterized protein (DUF433 family)